MLRKVRIDLQAADVDILQALVGCSSGLEMGALNPAYVQVLKKHLQRIRELQPLYDAIGMHSRYTLSFFKWGEKDFVMVPTMVDRMVLMSACCKLAEIFALFTQVLLRSAVRSAEEANLTVSPDILEQLSRIGKFWNVNKKEQP